MARSLRLALTEGGVTFVKLGQMLSTRADLLPAPFVAELSSLQDDVPPEPWEAVAPVIEAELGRPVDEVFTEVDRTPLAAASVGQVHAARLADGTEVVVKVQRPHARRQATGDLDIVLRLAAWLDRSTSWGRRLGVRDLARGFAASLEEELDYRTEVANMRAVAATLDPDGPVRVPQAWPELSGRRVMVIERLPADRWARRAPSWRRTATTGGARWPSCCWAACCGRSSSTASSTPTSTPATSSSTRAAASGCSTSAPWAASTRRPASRSGRC